MQQVTNGPILKRNEPRPVVRRLSGVQPPDWLDSLGVLHAGSPEPVVSTEDSRLVTVHRPLLGCAWADVQACVESAYEDLSRLLETDTSSVVRFWNHVPHLLSPSGDGCDVYMAFNAARHAALTRWPLDGSGLRWVASSAVGSSDECLHVHALVHRGPSLALENPRQRPAYQYSRRYGPVSPSFARATLLMNEERPMLITAGTASVRGEATMHAGDLAAQLEETSLNLAALSALARGDEIDADFSPDSAELDGLNNVYTHLRVYLPDASDEHRVIGFLRRHFTGAQQIEWMQAPLCRADLLVEIEAVGHVPLQRGIGR